MKKTTSIYLGERYNKFIQEQIATGLYESASEIIRESLRRLEDREIKIQILRKELEKGEKSGYVKGFTFAKFKKQMDKKYNN